MYEVTDKQGDDTMEIHKKQDHLGSEASCIWPLPCSAISDLSHPQAEHNAAMCCVYLSFLDSIYILLRRLTCGTFKIFLINYFLKIFPMSDISLIQLLRKIDMKMESLK